MRKSSVYPLFFAFSFFIGSAWATNHINRMDEIMAGMEGDPSVQYIMITAANDGEKNWGPQGGEAESRAMLVFFDAEGNQTGVFKFPNDAPNGAGTVLIATPAFTNRTGLRADFVIPPMLSPGSGKVCFRGNPANPNRFDVNLCLSYGAFPAGQTEGAGPPAPALPIEFEPTALVRFQNFVFGQSSSRNQDFRLDTPHPFNTAGQTANFGVPGPEITVFPMTFDFGGQVLGRRSATRRLTIQNLGFLNDLRIANVSLTTLGNEFRLVGDTGETVLGPNRTRVLQFDFSPLELGVRTGTLQVSSDDTNESLITISLIGRGVDLNPCAAPDLTAAAAMDNCTDAMLIGPGIGYTGTLDGATTDGANTCVSQITSGPDVWYRYVPANSGSLTVTVDRTTTDLRGISAHSGCPGTIANQLACTVIGNEGGSIPSQSSFTLNVSNRQEIFFRLAARTNTAPGFRLTLRGPAAFDFDQNNDGRHDDCEFDWADAPAPYPTTAAQNGPRHKRSPLFLGQRIDHDDDGQPTPRADGDNLDGERNDDDGIHFTSALKPGQTTIVEVTASAEGILNAWIDFNADGSWAESGEQIFTNQSLIPGLNALTITVPGAAVETNLTFARFRLASTPLVVPALDGPATDGEVEDYAVEIERTFPQTGEIPIRFSEVMAGLNGDSALQFVELEAAPGGQAWGPQAGETAGRTMLVFFDSAGKQTGRYVFPSNAPPGEFILIGTREFSEATGLRPDFLMPKEIMAVAGKVAFRLNPDNEHWATNPVPEVSIALSYGGGTYFGPTDSAGPANTNQLPITGASSLSRLQPVPFGYNFNDAFQLGPPTPRNGAGQSVALIAATLTRQGEALFSRETFNGNGRTCQTCHKPGRDQFSLTPATIASLDPHDSLFVFENNVNILKLATRSRPSDLRGRITGTSGDGQILAGSGDTYLVTGGEDLAGTITDSQGNSGQFQSFTDGDLDGPTPGNGSSRGLEDHDLLTHGRGLILENIDGFRKREVFRTSPHLLNLAFTAPYGMSGEFKDLREFSDGAVVQHFPRSLRRMSDVDFRHPTDEELRAMEAFMNSLIHPRDGNYDLNRFATTELQKRGRNIFFNNESKCFRCHSGPLLNEMDTKLPVASATGNTADTGVANLITNTLSQFSLPSEPSGFPPGQSTRKFNTPSLFGIRLTGPFFHEGSTRTLREAVQFYDRPEFLASPAGQDVGDVPAANDPAKIDALVAFLESLVELPIEFTRLADFGAICVGDTPPLLSVTLTNVGSNTVAFQSVTISGTNATNFFIVSDTGQTNLAAGMTRTLQLQFFSATQGLKQATLEFGASDPDIGSFSFGVALRGAMQDNIVSSLPAALAFSTLSIDAAATERKGVQVVNNGTSELVFQRIAILETGTNSPTLGATNFVLFQPPTRVAPGATGLVQVTYAPRFRGQHSATLRIEALACAGGIIEAPLTGNASTDLHHFTWEPIPSPQQVFTDFAVSISARDRNDEFITNFSGMVHLSGSVPGNIPPAVLITEVDPGSTDRIEISNLSGQPVSVSGWRVVIYDPLPTVAATVTIPTSAPLQPRAVFTVTEGGTAPGAMPNLFAGTNFAWISGSTTVGVLLLDAAGRIVDFFTTGDSTSVTNPVAIPSRHWAGPGVAAVTEDGASTFQRVGSTDFNVNTDWQVAAPSVGLLNPGLIVPPSGSFGAVFILPDVVMFQNGTWSGPVAVLQERVGLSLLAQDTNGHAGISNPIDVIGTPPIISGLSDQTVDEDTMATVMFTVSDGETPADELIATASSTHPVLFPLPNIEVTGNGSNRVLRVLPGSNQFGVGSVTVHVSDGGLTTQRSFSLTVNPVNDRPSLTPTRTPVVENFDNLIQLPSGWVSSLQTATSGIWRVVSTNSDTPANSVFINDPPTATESTLTSPTFNVIPSPTHLSFRHSFDTHACCDGGTLEISINQSNFVNIITSGGSFVTGGYNSGMSWRGDSGGFVTTVVTLPAAAAGRSIRFRWKFNSDASLGGIGWTIDTVALHQPSSTFNSINILEDARSPVLVALLSDPETAAEQLVFLPLSQSSLIPTQNIVVAGSGSSRAIEFRPATNQFGNTTLLMRVSDGNVETPVAVSVSVQSVNDAPVFAPTADRVAFVGEGLSISVSAMDIDQPPHGLAFSFATVGPPGALFNQVSPTNAIFTWRPTDNSRGSNTIRVIVRDLGPGLPAPIIVTQAFQVVVVPQPLTMTNLIDFGTICNSQASTGLMTVSLANTSTLPVTVTNFSFGSGGSEFAVISPVPPFDLGPGEQRPISIAFTPQTLGTKQVTLDLTAVAEGRAFRRSTSVRAHFGDNIARVTPSQINFGTVSIVTSSLPVAVTISNDATISLAISSVAIVGPNASDFRIVSDTGETSLAARAQRRIELTFNPQRRGVKSATFRINSVACNGAVDVALSGVGSSTVDHFNWEPIASPQPVNIPFPAQITAVDRNNEIVEEFAGPVFINAPASAVQMLTFIRRADLNLNGEYSNTLAAIRTHFSNFVETTTLETNVSALQASLVGKHVFLVVEQENEGGELSLIAPAWAPVLSNFVATGGTLIVCSLSANEHLLLTQSGLMSVTKLGTIGSTTLTPVGSHPFLEGVVTPFAATDLSSYAPGNGTVLLRNPSAEAVVVVRQVGAGTALLIGTDFFSRGTSLDLVLANAVRLSSAFLPGNIVGIANSGVVSSGLWDGSITVSNEISRLRLVAHDGAGHTGLSSFFDVLGTPPQITGVTDITLDEDTSTNLSLTVSDAETPAASLTLLASSSNSALLPSGELTISSSGSNRTLRLAPAANQFGLTTITLRLSDGGFVTTNIFLLRVRAINDPPFLSPPSVTLSENFDAAATIPATWSVVDLVGASTLFRLVTNSFDTAPHAVYSTNPVSSTDTVLISPAIGARSSSALLTFRHMFDTEPCCDGGVLEIAIGQGSFVNITSAGGTFISGGYTTPTAWRGNSAGPVTVAVTLPPSAAGQTNRLRWRSTSNFGTNGFGWLVDTIALYDLGGSNQISAITLDEDTSSVRLPFQVGDLESGSDDLAFTFSSSNPQLVPTTNIFVTGSGSNRFFQFRSATNQSGATTLRLTVSDGVAQVSHAFNVSVRPFDDPPLIEPIADRTIFGGEEISFTVRAFDPDDPPAPFTLTLVTPSQIGTNATLDSSTGLFRWLAPQTVGFATFSIIARDSVNPSVSSTQTFQIILQDPPVGLPRFGLNYGLVCTPESNRIATLSFTNVGTNVLIISELEMAGTNAADFRILEPAGDFFLDPGAVHNLEILFEPQFFGERRAQLNFAGILPETGRSFTRSVPLLGFYLDNRVTLSTTSLNFGPVRIFTSSPPSIVWITNNGTLPIQIFSTSFAGSNRLDFRFISDSGPTNLAPSAALPVEFVFEPARRGRKSAVLRVDADGCQGTLNVALSGEAVSTVDHFEWSSISSTQRVNNPFSAQIRALDVNNDLVDDFAGPVTIEARGALGDLTRTGPVRILSFVGFADMTPAGEYQGTLAALRAHFTNFVEATTATQSAANLAVDLADKDVFLVVEQEQETGQMAVLGSAWNPVLFEFVNNRGGTLIVCSHTANEHQLLVNSGLMNLIKIGSTNSSILFNSTVDSPLLAGLSAPFGASALARYAAVNGTLLLQTFGQNEIVVVERSVGAGRVVMIGTDFSGPASGLDRVLGNAARTARLPAIPVISSGSLTQGIWTGTVSIGREARAFRLVASDATGHSGAATPVNVSGERPSLDGIAATLTIDEDGATNIIVTVGDPETAPEDLLVALSVPGLLDATRTGVTGTGSQRTVTLTPVPNQSGQAQFFLSVSDGVLTTNRPVTLTILPVNDPPTIRLPGVSFNENFDRVSPPNLPEGWFRGGFNALWNVVNTAADTSPNSAFVSDPGFTVDSFLLSPLITNLSTSAQLTFRHRFLTEACCDGGFVELMLFGTNSISGEIISLGGSFVTGGYTSGNSWRGDSGGFITTTVNLPAIAAGRPLQLSWRFFANSVGSGTGWWVDSISLRNASNPPPDTIVMDEDALSPPIFFEIGDVENGPDNLQLAADSSNPGLIPPQSVQFGGFGAVRSLQFRPATNQSGSATLMVSVTDGITNAAASFNITVNPVNDPPVIAPVTNRNIFAGELLSIPLNVTDPDVPASPFVVQLVSAPGGVQLNTNTLIFQWRPTPAQAGTHTVQMIARDAAVPSISSTQAFQVTVAPQPLALVMNIDFGFVCTLQTTSTVFTTTISNISNNAIVLTDLRFTGANAADFGITSPQAPASIAGRSEISMMLSAASPTLGRKDAVLEFTATIQPEGRSFIRQVPVTVLFSDSILQSDSIQMDFGSIAIGTSSAIITNNIRNNGSVALAITSVSLVGSNASDFQVIFDTGESSLNPGASRVMRLRFLPQRRGAKSAQLRVLSTSCAGTNLVVPLSGFGVSTVASLSWDSISSPQPANTPFSVRITPRDINSEIVETFTGPITIEAVSPEQIRVLTFTAFADISANGEYLNTLASIRAHFTNFTETSTSNTDPTALRTALSARDVFLIVEQELDTSQMANLGSAWSAVLNDFVVAGGTIIVCSHAGLEHMLLNNSGLLDVTKLGSPTAATLNTATAHPLLEGVAVPFNGSFLGTYAVAVGTPLLTTSAGEAVVITRDIGPGRVVVVGTDFFTRGTSMDRVIANAVRLARSISPISISVSGSFQAGIWSGTVIVSNEVRSLRLLARHTNITGFSGAFDVLGTQPVVSGITDQTIDEDTAVQLPFTVWDMETPPDRLVLTVNSSQPGVIPDSHLIITGATSNRIMRLLSATNASGVAAITLRVRDGSFETVRTFNVTVQPVNDPPFLRPPGVMFSENFDSPGSNFSGGWSATALLAPSVPFRLVTNRFTSAPNAAFVPDPAFESHQALDSPLITILLPSPQLSFRHNFNTELCCDGGFVQISINGGSFVSINEIGASYVLGPPNSVGQFWTGNSSGFITTVVNLPSSLVGQTVRFRWRFFSSTSIGGEGWYIDDVLLRDGSAPSPLQPFGIGEDSTSSQVSFEVGDIDNNPSGLQVSGTSSQPELFANFLFGGSGPVRTLQIRPATNQFGNASVDINVSDGQASAVYSFPVTIFPSNDPPVIAQIPNRVAHAGELISFNTIVTDPDPDSFTFSISSTPPGLPAQINTNTGQFTWTVPATGGTNFAFSIRVVDNPNPAAGAPLSDTEMFQVSVFPSLHIDSISVSGGQVHISWAAIPGRTYRVQYKDDLNAATWQNLPGDIATGSNSITKSDPTPGLQRFYRVTALP